ncbi:MAG: Wadjet anti-phage system protein JetD domain-containing protein [Acetivibrionales bacterium]|jgi:hypothetical protein
MMNYKKLLLDRLLDKYEKSRSYTGQTVSNRRILLKLLKGDFPEYNVEKTEIRETINSVIQEYAAKELVAYSWLKHEKDNIIEKVWLRLDFLGKAYSEICRTPKGDIVGDILDMVLETQKKIKSEWIGKYLSDLRAGIEQKRSARPFLPDDAGYAQALLTALESIDKIGQEECLERVFSQKCFGDSKFFEKTIRKKVAVIIKKYLSHNSSEMECLTDDEALCSVGIVKAPELFDFCGSLTAEMHNQRFDFSPFIYGATINAKTAAGMKIINFDSVKRILFIENKANYLDYINKREPHELIVYHGGFYSPAKGNFFRKLHQAGLNAGVKFLHWSDIDLGGFHIFVRLRENIIPELEPYLMDEEAYALKAQMGMSFDSGYALLLEELLEKPEYKIFHTVIKLMLDKRLRIEQEVFIY